MMPEPFAPSFDNLTLPEIEATLREAVDSSLHIRYGAVPDAAIVKRLQEEWHAMEISGTIPDVAALYELTLWLKANKLPYRMIRTAGSSFMLYLLGVTLGNPLPPHYIISHRLPSPDPLTPACRL